MGDEFQILDPGSQDFKIQDEAGSERVFRIRELPIRRAGRLLTRIMKIVQKVVEAKPDMVISPKNLVGNLSIAIGIAEEDFYDALTLDVLGLNPDEREWFLENVPMSAAVKMIEALLQKNEKLIENFQGLAKTITEKKATK